MSDGEAKGRGWAVRERPGGWAGLAGSAGHADVAVRIGVRDDRRGARTTFTGSP